jgi:hypothetical protein
MRMDWGHGVAGKGIKYWMGLHVWCHDDSMLPEVQKESVPTPMANRFDNVERDPSAQIFECHSNVDAMTFELLTTG